MATDIYARIRQTAFELVSEGTWPTVAEVRQRLGTGSNTTINNTLKEWRQEFLARIAVASRRPDWSPGLVEAFEQIWQKACDEAERQLDSVREEALGQVRDLETAQAGLKTELEARAGELLSMVQALELKEARIGELEERLAREQEQRQALEGQLTQLQAALEGLREQQAQAQALFDQRLGEAEAKAEARVQEERQQAEKREALAYERLDGLRVRLYEQVEDERTAMKQTQKRLEEELASERKVKSQLENTWRERLSEAEREGGRLAATVQVQGERLAQVFKDLDEERSAGRENQARLLAVTEQIGTLRASHHALLDRLLPRLAGSLSEEGVRLAKLDEAALYVWLKNLAGELLPEASS